MVDWIALQDKWQKKWIEADLGKAKVSSKKKFFMIFAYPGISGFMHVGHMRGYSYTDAICRFERLKGKEVLFPVGTHASGNQAISFANKVKNKDEKWLNYLCSNGCSEKKLKDLEKPENIIEYFNESYVNDYWKKFGFICDWDRFTCTTYPDYEKFMQWQFKKLQQHDLLIQKPYFATACIVHGPVAVDASETDISKGGNAEKNEYTLLKFKLDGDYLVAATLRPETIFGQTNLWINPRAKYVRVGVEEENWIMSREAAEKLKFQKDDVMLKEDISIKNLIGKKALAPGINKEIPVLPAEFCDAGVGSGIVTCVPSDAPNDYVALRILQRNEELCREYDLDFNEIKGIELIPIIESKGYGLYPAQEIVQKMKISNLDDPKLKEATQEIYKAGFHTGVMRETCGKFTGKRVREAKELMKAELLEQGSADIFYDLSEEVICRCGEPVVIKRIDDQWFIRYSDAELTQKSKEHVKQMKIYPKEYHENMPSVLDWFSERACARLGNWLGSKFPFDERWTIEPISDSTLYPVYYIVSKYVKDGSLKVDDLTEEFFDYIYLGKGDATAENKDLWNKIREEFEYFYPLDINLGGKEHKTVHFPVFLMNHIAILKQEHWPKGIFINWWVTSEGGKISKSKGGAVPVGEAVAKYGVDAMRLYYAHIGSPHVDVVWTHEIVSNYKNSLERIFSLIDEVKELSGSTNMIDDWLLSRMNQNLHSINESMQEYELRELASMVYFNMYDDLRWYVRRGGANKKIIAEYISVWSRLMNPITPHLSEELFVDGGLASISEWPKVDQSKISLESNAGEELIKTAMNGMRNVIKLAKIEKPSKFTLFVSQNWLYELFNILSREIKITRNVGEIMSKVLAIEQMKMKGKQVSKLVQSVVKDASKLPNFVSNQAIELKVMNEAKSFLEKEFNCVVEIINGDSSEEVKAQSAVPGKVGILVE
jgi:leucyl-tRNA synthetase